MFPESGWCLCVKDKLKFVSPFLCRNKPWYVPFVQKSRKNLTMTNTWWPLEEASWNRVRPKQRRHWMTWRHRESRRRHRFPSRKWVQHISLWQVWLSEFSADSCSACVCGFWGRGTISVLQIVTENAPNLCKIATSWKTRTICVVPFVWTSGTSWTAGTCFLVLCVFTHACLTEPACVMLVAWLEPPSPPLRFWTESPWHSRFIFDALFIDSSVRWTNFPGWRFQTETFAAKLSQRWSSSFDVRYLAKTTPPLPRRKIFDAFGTRTLPSTKERQIFDVTCLSEPPPQFIRKMSVPMKTTPHCWLVLDGK